jgi:two-component system sensor histidine kinase RegB
MATKDTLASPAVRLDRPRPADSVHAAGLKNMQQLIQLRWFAVLGQILTIVIVRFGFNIPLPLEHMALALTLLASFNVACLLYWRDSRPVSERALFISLLVDVATLTAQLYFSGGATNPFIFLYLLQVILGAVLLQRHYTWTIVAITAVCFVALTRLHFPLSYPEGERGSLADPYALGVLVCFALNASLLVVFVTRISRNLRTHDASLADLRQRAAEEEHIVRMGLLASGAAHELGTPLSTLAVILGDWHRMPFFASDPELLHDVEEMQAQVLRCKNIVTGILLSAGEARGEAPIATTVTGFLDELVAEWRATRSSTALNFRNEFGEDVCIISDSALKQTIHNVLDNAIEASPVGVTFTASQRGDRLVLEVADVGHGFDPDMLESLGKPYQSSKGRAGGGLGLFLVVNVLRKLGGSVSAGNRPEGGAIVTMSLPLASIQREIKHNNGN